MLDFSSTGKIYIPKDATFREHEKSMGGYKADEAYGSKTELFRKYFFNYHLSRLEHYHDFIKGRISKDQDILSLASGRCLNELYLMEEGYKIVCSDLEIPDVYRETKALFPNFIYLIFDALSGPAERRYDSIICLSLIYLFDQKQLLRFFHNVSASLKMGGRLVLDSGGSSDNFLSYLIHDVVLRYETILRRIVRLIKDGRCYRLVVKDFGYRRTDNEIIEAAGGAGLELTLQKNYAFLTEFSRSHILGGIMKKSRWCKRIFGVAGKNIPYVRMFDFKKVK